MRKIDHPLYKTWDSMIGRCHYTSSASWRYYGARGIMVCTRWFSFVDFVDDMGERPEGMVLDRIDNDGNYEPSNCRWVTRAENIQNSTICSLTKEDVREIRNLHCKGDLSNRRIAKRFAISHQTVNNIVNRVSWRNVA